MLIYPLADEATTRKLGQYLARHLPTGWVIYLQGALGAGKTALVRSILQTLGHVGPVTSPTYTLLQHYSLPEYPVLHMDLYRLSDPGELDFLGIDEWLDNHTLWFVEWADHGTGYLPPADLIITMDYGKQINNRLCRMELLSERAREWQQTTPPPVHNRP